MPTAEQNLTPPAANNGTRPSWIDDPDMTRIDWSAIQQVADGVKTGLEQGIVNRTSESFNTPAPDPSELAMPNGQQFHPITGEPIEANPSLDADALNQTQQAAPVTEPAATTEPTTELPASDATFTVSVGTNPDGTPQTIDITQEQAQQLILSNQWMQQRRPEVLQQWAAIDEGSAVAIAAEEAAQFRAWKALGSPTSAPATTPVRPDLSYLDADARAYVERLEATAKATTDLPPGQSAPAYQVPVSQPAVQPGGQQYVDPAIAVLRQQQMDTVTTAVVGKYGLDAASVDALQASVVRSNVIPRLMMEQRVVSPTGQLIREADFGVVLSQAYEMTMATDPTLRPLFEQQVVNQHLAKNQANNATVQSKKALAGSLASTAPAAVTSIPKDPAHMNPQESRDAISAHLRELQAAGTFGN